jgi:hypothetical protein
MTVEVVVAVAFAVRFFVEDIEEGSTYATICFCTHKKYVSIPQQRTDGGRVVTNASKQGIPLEFASTQGDRVGHFRYVWLEASEVDVVEMVVLRFVNVFLIFRDGRRCVL